VAFRCFCLFTRKLEESLLMLVFMTGSPEECADYSVTMLLRPGDGEGAFARYFFCRTPFLNFLSYEGTPVPAETDRELWREVGLTLQTGSRFLSQ
jgi:hypothetical protein